MANQEAVAFLQVRFSDIRVAPGEIGHGWEVMKIEPGSLVPGTFCGLADVESELFQKHLEGLTGVGVEIGCCDGYSTCVILAASQLHLTSIDPLIADSMEKSLCGSEERLMKNTERFGERFQFLWQYSQDVVKDWTLPLDFVFIDGDHSYEAATADIESWGKLLMIDGIMAVHDSRMGRNGGAPFHEGTSQAARELIYGRPDRWDIIGEAFSLTMARKHC